MGMDESRRGQGIIEAASCVCNGKCEKPMEDATNCPCDCAPKRKKLVQPAKPTAPHMVGPNNEKNLPELIPESTVGGGIVAKLGFTSDNDELNETKVALDRAKCDEAFTAGNKTCFSCAELIGCGFCASEGSCIPGDNNGPYYRNCSEGWKDASFTCSDNPNQDDIKVIPTTTIQDDMAPSATGTVQAVGVNATGEKKKKKQDLLQQRKKQVVAAAAAKKASSGPAAAAKKPAASGPAEDAKSGPASSGASGATGTSNGDDDDSLDDDENDSDKAAANVTVADKKKTEEPISKSLKEIEIDVEALNDKATALLNSLKGDMSKVSHPEIDVARYLKQAAAISKKLHAIKSGAGKEHDAFVAKLRTLMEGVMKALNEGTDAIAKASEKPKAATGVAKPIQPKAATAGNAENDDDDESQTEAKTGASGAAAAASAGSSEDGDEDEDT